MNLWRARFAIGSGHLLRCTYEEDADCRGPGVVGGFRTGHVVAFGGPGRWALGRKGEARTFYEAALQLAKTVQPEFQVDSIPGLEKKIAGL